MTSKFFFTVFAMFIVLMNVSIPVSAEAKQVHNSDIPVNGVQDLHLEDIWVIGPENEDFLIGIINKAVVDSQGKVYLLDYQQMQVHVVGMDDSGLPVPMGTLSRRGEGPGELRSFPNSLFFISEDELGLVERSRAEQASRIVRISTEDIPRGSLDLRVGIHDVKYGNGYFLVAGFYHQGDDFLARFEVDGSRKMVYWRSEYTIDMTERKIQFFHYDAFAINSKAQVYVAPEWDKYLIEVYGPSEKMLMTISRDYELQQRDETDMRRGMKRVIGRESIKELDERKKQILENYGIEVVVEKYDRVVLGLHLQDNGELWVRTTMGEQDQDKGVICTYDVFDAEGRFDRQVRILGNFDINTCRLFLTRDHHVIIIDDGPELNTSGAQYISYHKLVP